MTETSIKYKVECDEQYSTLYRVRSLAGFAATFSWKLRQFSQADNSKIIQPQAQSSLIAKNGDIVVFGDIAENGDNISPFSAIFHLPFYFGGYQGVHGKTRECNTRIR